SPGCSAKKPGSARPSFDVARVDRQWLFALAIGSSAGFGRTTVGGQELREDFSAGGDAPNGRARRGRLRAAMVAQTFRWHRAADGASANASPAIGEVLRSATPLVGSPCRSARLDAHLGKANRRLEKKCRTN